MYPYAKKAVSITALILLLYTGTPVLATGIFWGAHGF
jgi:hypothetical protein